MWQFKESVEGISAACEALDPGGRGNVSFYNETDGIDIHPTPVVGLLGLADPPLGPSPTLPRLRRVWRSGRSAPNRQGTCPARPRRES